MRFFRPHTLIFLIVLVSNVSCSHTRSGNYVFKDGKWVFVHNNVGFLHEYGTSRDYQVDMNVDTGRFMWPVPSSRRVSSKFGKRGKAHHDGIDIPARSGANIIASDDGKVAFAGKMRGYGRIIVVKHDGGYHTVYAHNQKNYVKKGQRVSRGEVIALVGSSGRSTGPHVHFEIRKNNRSRNPASYISINRVANGR